MTTVEFQDKPLWQPTPAQIAGSGMAAFAARAERLSGQPMPDYAALHAWSIAEQAAFWREIWQYGDVLGAPGERVLVDGERMPGAAWFPDARLNFAENLLRPNGNEQALVFWGEDKVKPSCAPRWRVSRRRSRRPA